MKKQKIVYYNNDFLEIAFTRIDNGSKFWKLQLIKNCERFPHFIVEYDSKKAIRKLKIVDNYSLTVLVTVDENADYFNPYYIKIGEVTCYKNEVEVEELSFRTRYLITGIVEKNTNFWIKIKGIDAQL